MRALDDSSLPQTETATSAVVLESAPAQPAPAFREVYDTYFELVWRLAANRGVPSAALDDVVQEVFIVVHRKLAGFEQRSSIRTWIVGIVRRVVADHKRKRSNQFATDHPLESELDSLRALCPDPALAVGPEALERKAAVELLDALLAKMNDEQREVFVLHEIEQLSGADIASLTGVNINTVWTRLRAARRSFEAGVARELARQNRELP